MLSVESSAVCMMTGMNGSDSSPLMRRTTSNPSIFGIITGSRMRSRCGADNTRSSPTSPSAASSTIYPRASSRARSSWILSALSSTTSMRLGASSGIGPTKEPLYLGDNCAGLTRFGQVSVTSYFHGLLSVGSQGMRSERNYWNVPCCRVVFEHLRRLPAVNHRYRDIHEDQIGLLGASFRYALLSVQSLKYAIAEMLENRRVDDTVVFVVFHE